MKHKKKSKLVIIRKLLLIPTIICIIIMILQILDKQNKQKMELTPELLRSQSYDVVQENDALVKDESGNTITAVQFDSFFLKDLNGDGTAESIRGACTEIGSQSDLYMELKVIEDGYLTDGVITINSNNFYFKTAIVKDNEVVENYISSNTKQIKFNDISNGTQKLLIGSVRSGDYSSSYSKNSAIGNDTTKYSMENSVTFSGTYVDSSGNKASFTKTVPFMVDWYGEVDCGIYETESSKVTKCEELDSLIADEGLKLDFIIETKESLNKLIMEGSYLSGTIPKLNGYMPIEVKITGTNVTYTYDEETGAFTAERRATLNENTRCGYNKCIFLV